MIAPGNYIDDGMSLMKVIGSVSVFRSTGNDFQDFNFILILVVFERSLHGRQSM